MPLTSKQAQATPTEVIETRDFYNEVEVKDDLTGEVIGTKNQYVGTYSKTQIQSDIAMFDQQIEQISKAKAEKVEMLKQFE